ncbi:Male sterility protein [Natronoarchaeum philippinense]|uniref:Male sterility protein n=1 Tax=Natronoarchaeum philippinense TaxID=558529 RepID=A0A285N168_NATPI|nr:Male sterility protein [Natronoarchaeum philippinense]
MALVTVFLTGFPGFLGSALIERLLDRDRRVACLVQPKYREEAGRRAAELAGEDDEIRLYEGDITESDLGLDADDRTELQSECTEAFHLAAVYDLGVSRAVGEAVNVDGTEHVLDFVEGFDDLQRLHYVSTCYVSGRHDGVFAEDDLDVGQTFNNHYEATKFEAEVAVQERMAAGIPATIYRPAIVVGDSETGRTEKYDGPYYLLKFLLDQPGVAALPRPPGAGDCEINVVPRDYVVDAIDHLSALEASEGEVYQLCDPNPPTVAEMTDALAAAAGTRVLSVPAPKRPVKRALAWQPVRRWTGIEPAVLDYFDHPTRYVGPRAREHLAGTGIAPPPFESYVEAMARFVRGHPEIGSDARA